MFSKGPTITSPLDTDSYKLTMGQLIFLKYRDVPATFSLTNRTTSVPLAKIIPESVLREELDHAMALRFTESALEYLRNTRLGEGRMFFEDYLNFLRNLRRPPYDLEYHSDQIRLEFRGPWSETTYWEIPALAIINELRNRFATAHLSSSEKEKILAVGRSRRKEKIKILKENPWITFIDFGTRRRFSGQWQDETVEELVSSLPSNQFTGTSNVWLAMKHGIPHKGTSAHELFMAMSGIMHGSDDEIRRSHDVVLEDWWNQYGSPLSIALSDNYGSKHTFESMGRHHAVNWKGLRQDSGDPYRFGEKAIQFYKSYGIDPKQKLIVFSDGLDIHTIVQLANHFKGRIGTTFGWGTNLTNDLHCPTEVNADVKPLSLVIKLTEANGHGTVKLSDNIAKAIGKPKDIERFKRIFKYDETFFEPCMY